VSRFGFPAHVCAIGRHGTAGDRDPVRELDGEMSWKLSSSSHGTDEQRSQRAGSAVQAATLRRPSRRDEEHANRTLLWFDAGPIVASRW